jgi:ABC-type bacteriocin/lantibiotic exporter with double-glycine peptidase domain
MINENTLTPVQRFWRLLKPDQKEIYNVYAYATFNGLVNLSLPLGIQAIVNLIQGGQISTSWIVLVCFVVLGIAATGIFQLLQLRITENLQKKIFARAAFEFAYRMPRVKMEALYKQYAPELMNRFLDVVSVQKGLSKVLIDFSTAVLHVLFGLLLLSFYHPFFIGLSFILMLLVYLIFRFTLKNGLETSLKESKYKYQVVHWLEELARTLTTFKLAGKTSLPLERTDNHVGDYLKARKSHFTVLVQQYSLMVVFKVFIAGGLLIIGGILVMEQQMNIGQFVGAEIIILLVMSSVEKLVMSLETIYDVLTSLEKIGQVTDLELESNEGDKLNPDEGIEVALDNVVFAYPGNPRKTLNGLSLTVKKGEKLVITGPNNSGKSTLLHVLSGLYDIQGGSVAYNKLPKGNLEVEGLREAIGNFFTEEQLFEGTVMENITMGREAATKENVYWVVEKLALQDFITSLPKGYNTILEPLGKNLPKSAKLKLLLARSIVIKPKLLLFEGVFEHLDKKENQMVIDFLTAKENNWTMVAVSSDPYLAERVDTVAIMSKGKIIHKDSYEKIKDIRDFNSTVNA